MLSKSLYKVLNDQLGHELFASHLYLALSAYCDREDFPGMAKWFQKQSEEERGHAMKIYNFLVEKNQDVVIQSLDEPKTNFKSVQDAFQAALGHESKVTRQMYLIMDMALKEKEHSTVSFLKWFIDEQVEEEALFHKVIKSLKRVGNDGPGLLYLDREFGSRTEDGK